MILLIDDAKTPDVKVDIIARTYSAGMIVISTGYIDTLYLDFDLGGDKTGLDVLRDCQTRSLPSVVYLVSMNPVGLGQMRHFLLDNGYKESFIVTNEIRLRFEKIA